MKDEAKMERENIHQVEKAKALKLKVMGGYGDVMMIFYCC